MSAAEVIKVIVTDVESRKGFDVANIMQRLYGFSCVFCASKHHKVKMPLIFGRKVFQLRSSDLSTFSEDFDALREVHVDTTLVYLPVSEKPTRLLYQYLRTRSVSNLKFLLPSEDNFDLCANKYQFQQFCERKGFPVPRSYGKEDLPELESAFRPLVLKPRVGEGSMGIRYLDSPQALSELSDIDWSAYVLQERVSSKQQVAGAFFLCKDGQVISAYTHQRLRTFPPEGGVTVYSQSTYEEELVGIGRNLLKSLRWDGVAMIEFLYDEEQRAWRIIELNPRIWGSIMLSAFNGSDMLKHYVQASLEDELPSRPESRSCYIRWYYPFEILNWARGTISLRTLLRLERDRTCYVNFTYAGFWRSVGYLLYFTFNVRSFRRFFKKLGL